MATEAAEDYLKAVYRLAGESATGEAGMTRLAAAVGVTTGTATSMVKKLAAAKLVRYERFGGVRLTAKGTRAALDILRRHRLVETFLVRTLELDWSEVHEEAERLEHAVSARVLAALDRHLGHPAVDPHGDPIPRADGAMATGEGRSLDRCVAGERVRLARALDQREGTLRYLEGCGLTIGREVAVECVEEVAGTVRVRVVGGGVVTLGVGAAGQLVVERVGQEGRGRRR